MADPSSKHPESSPSRRGLSRRRFMTATGLATAGAAIVPGLAAAHDAGIADAPVLPAADRMPVVLRVNGRPHKILVEPRWSLLYVLRERLGLTGAKPGCERGECGACTVLVDGVTRYSCLTLAVEAAGAEITTVEGLLDGEELGDVQRAFVEDDAFQCGYCTPGQIMAVEGLLRHNPRPSLEEIRLGTSGNLCRCGAYPNVCRAAARAARLRMSEGRSSENPSPENHPGGAR